MRRYTVTEVEAWVVDAHLVGGIVTTDTHRRVVALVEQANAAWESERRAERAEAALAQEVYRAGVAIGALRAMSGVDK